MKKLSAIISYVVLLTAFAVVLPVIAVDAVPAPTEEANAGGVNIKCKKGETDVCTITQLAPKLKITVGDNSYETNGGCPGCDENSACQMANNFVEMLNYAKNQLGDNTVGQDSESSNITAIKAQVLKGINLPLSCGGYPATGTAKFTDITVGAIFSNEIHFSFKDGDAEGHSRLKDSNMFPENMNFADGADVKLCQIAVNALAQLAEIRESLGQNGSNDWPAVDSKGEGSVADWAEKIAIVAGGLLPIKCDNNGGFTDIQIANVGGTGGNIEFSFTENGQRGYSKLMTGGVAKMSLEGEDGVKLAKELCGRAHDGLSMLKYVRDMTINNGPMASITSGTARQVVVDSNKSEAEQMAAIAKNLVFWPGSDEGDWKCPELKYGGSVVNVSGYSTSDNREQRRLGCCKSGDDLYHEIYKIETPSTGNEGAGVMTAVNSLSDAVENSSDGWWVKWDLGLLDSLDVASAESDFSAIKVLGDMAVKGMCNGSGELALSGDDAE